MVEDNVVIQEFTKVPRKGKLKAEHREILSRWYMNNKKGLTYRTYSEKLKKLRNISYSRSSIQRDVAVLHDGKQLKEKGRNRCLSKRDQEMVVEVLNQAAKRNDCFAWEGHADDPKCVEGLLQDQIAKSAERRGLSSRHVSPKTLKRLKKEVSKQRTAHCKDPNVLDAENCQRMMASIAAGGHISIESADHPMLVMHLDAFQVGICGQRGKKGKSNRRLAAVPKDFKGRIVMRSGKHQGWHCVKVCNGACIRECTHLRAADITWKALQ